LSTEVTARVVIRPCVADDFEAVYAIINDAAEAFRGIIPAERWKWPYKTREEVQYEIDCGVAFWGYEEDETLVGVMGIQEVLDVALIRHAYVRTVLRHQGIGSRLLSVLRKKTVLPVLVATWTDAVWAVRFYRKHGFHPVSPSERVKLLQKYWGVPARQAEGSTVLAENSWTESGDPGA
jgi:GNAT superfamily N-acetyltransferase